MFNVHLSMSCFATPWTTRCVTAGVSCWACLESLMLCLSPSCCVWSLHAVTSPPYKNIRRTYKHMETTGGRVAYARHEVHVAIQPTLTTSYPPDSNYASTRPTSCCAWPASCCIPATFAAAASTTPWRRHVYRRTCPGRLGHSHFRPIWRASPPFLPRLGAGCGGAGTGSRGGFLVHL